MCWTKGIALLVAACCLLFLGCGSDEPSEEAGTVDTAGPTTTGGETGATIQACGLLTDDDVATLLGPDAQPEEGMGSEATDTATCSWRETNKPEEEAKLLTLTVGEAGQYAEVKAAQPEAQAVAGLGDEAFSAVGSTGPLVAATDGEHSFQIQLIGGTDADLAALQALLGEAMANLDAPGAVNETGE
jgi:hypothetical protein